MYYLYILKCSDNTLYTGITTDLERRLHEHNNTTKGAKYTKLRRPVEMVYSEEHLNRSLASKREYAVKKLPRQKKLQLISDSEHAHENV